MYIHHLYIYVFVCCNRFYVCFARFNLENISPYKLSMLLLPHCVVVLLRVVVIIGVSVSSSVSHLLCTLPLQKQRRQWQFCQCFWRNTHAHVHKNIRRTLVNELLFFYIRACNCSQNSPQSARKISINRCVAEIASQKIFDQTPRRSGCCRAETQREAAAKCMLQQSTLEILVYLRYFSFFCLRVWLYLSQRYK